MIIVPPARLAKVSVVIICYVVTQVFAFDRSPVFWLHVPKCGTSFGLSAAAYPRSSERSPFPPRSGKWRSCDVEHQSIPVSANKKLLRSVVTMFRSPEDRRMSAYNWKKQNPVCCKSDWGWTQAEEKRVREIARQDSIDGSGSGDFAVMAMGKRRKRTC